MIIRKVTLADAPLVLAFTQALDSQTPFMLREPGERKLTLKQQKMIIQRFIQSTSSVMFVAYDPSAKVIAGFCVGSGSDFKKTEHCVHCVIGVLEHYAGQGYGRQLLNTLETWAKNNRIRRLELTVMEHNDRAIKLYDSLGFIAEGLKQDSIKLGDKFVSEICMCKLLC